MQVINLKQGTKEWHDIRRAKVTGSCLDEIMGSELARAQLIAELIAEEATEQSKIMRPTAEMERGTNEEPFAIKAFEERTGKKLDSSIGFCISDEFDWFGFSPDGGYILNDGKYTEGVEVKSPDSKTAIFYRMTNMIPDLKIPKSKQSFLGVPLDYKWQVVGSFKMNQDLEKLSFLTYDARFIDPEQRLYVVEVYRNDPLMQEALQELHEAMIKFRADWMRWKEIVLPTNF